MLAAPARALCRDHIVNNETLSINLSIDGHVNALIAAFLRISSCCMPVQVLFSVLARYIYMYTQATASGLKEQEAVNNLEKKFKHGGPVTLDETLDAAITSLQAVLSSDFKPDEVEVAVASKTSEGVSEFRNLSLAEIEFHLTRIAERD
jgi:hypothetical protein